MILKDSQRKRGPRQAVPASPGNSLDRQTVRPHPRPTDFRTLGKRPRNLVLTSPPGESYASLVPWGKEFATYSKCEGKLCFEQGTHMI